MNITKQAKSPLSNTLLLIGIFFNVLLVLGCTQLANKTFHNNHNLSSTTTNIDWNPLFRKYQGQEILKVSTNKKIVAFTFDAGGDKNGVDKILNILAKEHIQGTFFLTGEFIENFPDKAKEIIATGGDLGNHSYSHPFFTQISNKEINQELNKTEKQIAKLGTSFKPFFRFPFGDSNTKTISAINNKNYLNIGWTVDSLGWKGTSGGMNQKMVENRVISTTKPGAIILMHLGSNPDDNTQLDSAALPKIIKALKGQGYEFVTLTNLLLDETR